MALSRPCLVVRFECFLFCHSEKGLGDDSGAKKKKKRQRKKKDKSVVQEAAQDPLAKVGGGGIMPFSLDRVAKTQTLIERQVSG